MQPEVQESMTIAGGWTPFSCNISNEDKAIFEKAVDLIGVEYTPVALASQVVEGVNYKFFCNAKGVYPGATNEAVMIEIYAPLNGTPHIVKIQKV